MQPLGLPGWNPSYFGYPQIQGTNHTSPPATTNPSSTTQPGETGDADMGESSDQIALPPRQISESDETLNSAGTSPLIPGGNVDTLATTPRLSENQRTALEHLQQAV